jgi:hypothetical protein
MDVRKVVAGSVLMAGLGAAGMFGAGTAFAGPGVSFDNGTGGTNTVGFGDRSEATGATAVASEGNRALAVNIGSKTGTQAIADGRNNNVVSIDGVAVTGPDTENNNVVNAFGITSVGGAAKNNNVVTVAGATVVDGDAHDNTIINAGGVVSSFDQGDAPGALSVSVCGTSISGQADHIEVSDVGICSGEE